MNDATFCDLFCAAYNCLPEDCNELVFWLCVFPQVLFLARLIWKVNRGFFKPDFALIEQVKSLKNVEDTRQEISDFTYHNPARGFLRGFMEVRVSGQRLLDLAAGLFAKAG